MDKFFGRLVEDLETYAVHAKRKTIDVEDAELLLRRYLRFVSTSHTKSSTRLYSGFSLKRPNTIICTFDAGFFFVSVMYN